MVLVYKIVEHTMALVYKTVEKQQKGLRVNGNFFFKQFVKINFTLQLKMNRHFAEKIPCVHFSIVTSKKNGLIELNQESVK